MRSYGTIQFQLDLLNRYLGKADGGTYPKRIGVSQLDARWPPSEDLETRGVASSRARSLDQRRLPIWVFTRMPVTSFLGESSRRRKLNLTEAF